MKSRLSLLAILIVVFTAPLSAQWRLEAWFGDAWNAPSSITFHQDGEEPIEFVGRWKTEPWRPTWYYSGRVAKWDGESAWAFEYMHHKLYLQNPTTEVTTFRITNGVNNLMGERLWRKKGWEFGVAAGPVIAVPISVVRGKHYGGANGIFNSRYELSGGTLQVNLARRLKLIPYTFGSLSVKGTATALRVTIGDGHANLMNYALHLQYGLSLQTKR